MRIWRAGREEAGDVARLLVAFRDWMGRDWPGDDSIRASVERLIGDPDTEYLLAADGNGPPAGVAQLRYRWTVWWAAEDCWIEDVFVAESARGTGLGRALVQGALDRAAERGCRRVDLDTDHDNIPARRLYESLGFVVGPQLLLRNRR
jgi:ribosomal protein S18 acetylase RimI-like enzyme